MSGSCENPLMFTTAKSTTICSCDTKQFEVLMGMGVNGIQCEKGCMGDTDKLPCMLHATLSQHAHKGH